MNRMATEANASLISNRSMSSAVRPALARGLTGGRGRAGQHDGRIGAGDGGGHKCAPSASGPAAVPTFSLPMTQSAAPSTMPDELPAVCTWLISSTQWYSCSATASNPPSRPCMANEAGSEAQRVERGVGPDELVAVQDGQPVAVLDRHDRGARNSRWPTPWPRGSGTRPRTCRRPRGPHPSRVAIEVGADALRDEAGAVVGVGVGCPGAAVGEHRYPRHPPRRRRRGSGPPCRKRMRRRGLVDRLQPGRTEAVELHAGHGVGAGPRRWPRPWRCRRPGHPPGRPRLSTMSSMVAGSRFG